MRPLAPCERRCPWEIPCRSSLGTRVHECRRDKRRAQVAFPRTSAAPQGACGIPVYQRRRRVRSRAAHHEHIFAAAVALDRAIRASRRVGARAGGIEEPRAERSRSRFGGGRFTTMCRQRSPGDGSRSSPSTIRVLGKSARPRDPDIILERSHWKTHLDVVLALWIGIWAVQIEFHARTVIRLIATSGQPVRHQHVPLGS